MTFAASAIQEVNLPHRMLLALIAMPRVDGSQYRKHWPWISRSLRLAH